MELGDLEAVLRDRRAAVDAGNAPEGSYSAALFADSELVRRKIMEEAFELCLELGRETVDAERVVEEAADVVFHTLAGIVGAGVAWQDVMSELERRR